MLEKQIFQKPSKDDRLLDILLPEVQSIGLYRGENH